MFWIVLSILFWIGIGISLVVFFGSDKTKPEPVTPNPTGYSASPPVPKVTTREWAGVTAAVLFILWIVSSGFFMVHTVGQRQVGVIYSFSGTISGKTGNGVVLTAPWQHIQIANVGIQREPFALDTDNSAVSKDQQAVYANLVLNYQIQPEQILSLYKSVGPAWKTILLDSRVLQDFKEVTAQFQASDITRSRPQLRSETRTLLEQELARYDIKVVDFFVTNLHFNDAYNQSITERNVQVQKALQAQAKVAQARAEAEQAIATAEGQAKSIELKGRALRNNPEVLKLEYIDKLAPNVKLIVPAGSNIFTGNGLFDGK